MQVVGGATKKGNNKVYVCSQLLPWQCLTEESRANKVGQCSPLTPLTWGWGSSWDQNCSRLSHDTQANDVDVPCPDSNRHLALTQWGKWALAFSLGRSTNPYISLISWFSKTAPSVLQVPIPILHSTVYSAALDNSYPAEPSWIGKAAKPYTVQQNVCGSPDMRIAGLSQLPISPDSYLTSQNGPCHGTLKAPGEDGMRLYCAYFRLLT